MIVIVKIIELTAELQKWQNVFWNEKNNAGRGGVVTREVSRNTEGLKTVLHWWRRNQKTASLSISL